MGKCPYYACLMQFASVDGMAALTSHKFSKRRRLEATKSPSSPNSPKEEIATAAPHMPLEQPSFATSGSFTALTHTLFGGLLSKLESVGDSNDRSSALIEHGAADLGHLLI